MITIILLVALLIAGTVVVFVKCDCIIEGILGTVALWFVGGLCVGLPLVNTIAAFGNGIYPDYSQGTRIGYLTKVSEKGLIYKTVECELQVGTGSQTAQAEPFAFSLGPIGSDAEAKINTLVGRKVEVKYSQWITLPCRMGGTDYLATNVTEIVEGK